MFLTGQHALVSSVRDGVDVGRDFVPPLVDVHLDRGLRVDGEPLVRVHGHAEQPRVSLILASKRDKKNHPQFFVLSAVVLN